MARRWKTYKRRTYSRPGIITQITRPFRQVFSGFSKSPVTTTFLGTLLMMSVMFVFMPKSYSKILEMIEQLGLKIQNLTSNLGD
jgi:hypothetical protein